MPPVAILLSILASAVTLVACVMAWRARRAAQRLALEMIHLRDRLVRAEAHYKTDAARGVPARGRAAPPEDSAADESLGPRLSALEERLRVTLEHSAGAAHPAAGEAAHPATAELRTRILKHLRHRGYEHVRFLEDSTSAAIQPAAMEGASEGLLVEAERGGVTAKGRVDLLPDGSLQMRAVSTVRAFP